MATTTSERPLGKRMTKAAVIGGVLGIPLPIIGPIAGAAIGAAYIYWKARKSG